MATPSKTSTTEKQSNPDDAQKKTRWSLLQDCSHSSAVAVGQRCRLAFHIHGLQAFGGYLEGFLPSQFAVSAVASDDKILAFLQLNDDPITLEAGKTTYQLSRGDTVIKFESTADIPLPDTPHPPEDASVIALPDSEAITALIDCVPKTGWGSLNAEMLGVVLDHTGVLSTDNNSLAWLEYDGEIPGRNRLIVPRPFCLALVHWVKVLGKEYTAYASDSAIYARWATDEVLSGILPVDNKAAIDFSGVQNWCKEADYIKAPDNLAALLDEAAIFSDDLILESTGKLLRLSTAGPTAWYRDLPWKSHVTPSLTVPMKRLRTALDYAQHLAVTKDGRVHLCDPDKHLYVVVATK